MKSERVNFSPDQSDSGCATRGPHYAELISAKPKERAKPALIKERRRHKEAANHIPAAKDINVWRLRAQGPAPEGII